MTTATVNFAPTGFDAVRRQGDTAPNITATLFDDAGVAVVLTGSTCVLNMRNQLTKVETIVSGACTLVNAALGQVSYAMQAADTAASGIFEFEFLVTTAGGAKTSYPNGRFLILNVFPAI